MDGSGTGRRLVVDRSVCAGHGLCYGRAPMILDCDDQGDPVMLIDELSQSQLAEAETAVRACPEHALSVEPIA